jgi:DNA-binding beta-propeller fold protein YncE
MSVLLGAACDSGAPDPVGPAADTWENLAPVPNPDPFARPQPLREHPYAVTMTADGTLALVTLRGSEVEPADRAILIDVPGRRVRSEFIVGSRPTAVAMHPDGDLAVVVSHLSPFAAVIDVSGGDVSGRIRVGYYAQDLVFSPDGARLYTSNRATDQVEEFILSRAGNTLEASVGRVAPAGVNPDAIALSPDNSKLYVADLGGLGVRVYDVSTFAEVAFIDFNAPVFDLQPMGQMVIAATLNDTDGLPCEDDSDFPGEQGDGIYEIITDRTCSRGFADVQNEIAFINPVDDTIAVRYTSDTAEASEADREGDHPAELMKVVGALPHSIAVLSDTRAYVTMGASFEVAELIVDASDPLAPPVMISPRIWNTGLAPRGVAVDPSGTTLVVANMLGETATILDIESGERSDLVIGENDPPFPSTGAEIGELYFFTSVFSTDGDQSCVHCHPDAESDGKAWGVGVVRAFGRRAAIPARNLGETRPLLVEGVFEEGDFQLEMEGISFRPDFHDSSYALQVSRRDDFYRRESREMVGYEIGFDEMKARLGDYLVIEPRLLPNPFADDTPEVNRGRDLFFRFEVACASCHPSPAFASPEVFEGITTMARFDRAADLDPDVSLKFLENARDGFFNSNTLRGLWDRRGVLFHDGRARTTRETLLTPGHPCLLEGELAFNEFNGVPDSHGGISHLTCEEIDDLVAFLHTID